MERVSSDGAAERYRQAIADHLGTPAQGVSLFWKGRVGLYAILRALGVGPGDEVVVPAFTCVVVPNVVMYLGATPVYADIDAATYTAEAAQIEPRLSPRTRVILAQNTFGLAPDLDPILELAEGRGVRVVEDCAHGFGGTYRSRPNGTTADVSFFSTQWSKPFTTGLGGFTATTDGELAAALRKIEAGLAQPTRRDELILRLLLFARKRVMPRTGYWTAIRLYRALSRRRLVIGSSDSSEVESAVMPDDFLKGFSAVQAAEGVVAMAQLPGAVAHQRRVAARYAAAIAELGVAGPKEPPYADHTFLRYPLLVGDRRGLLERAIDQGVELGDWFASPVHPVEAGLERWHYRWGENPTAERTCTRIVNLPTHQQVDERISGRVIDFLRRNRELLDPS